MTDVPADLFKAERLADSDFGAPAGQADAVARATSGAGALSGSIGHDLDVELVRLFAEGRRGPRISVLMLGATAALVSAVMVPVAAILLWLSLQGAALVFSRFVASSCLALPIRAIEPRSWHGKFIGTEVLQGVSWALLVLLLGQAHDPAAPALMVILLFLVGAVNATTPALTPGAVIGILTPMTATILASLLAAGSLDATWPLVASACCAEFHFTHLARKLYATARATLFHQAEKDGLIADLESAKAASDLARRRAEEANVAKSRFLAAMSHELRTPLNAILGFSEVMKNELFGAHAVASYKEYSRDIHASGQHLLVLINEILDLSRIEAGRFELKEQPVPLAVVVDECKHLMTLRAKQRDIRVEAAVERNMPPLWADDRALRQITLNLLSNAAKFTPRRGMIEIKVGWTSKGGQYFSVRDTGPGIPEEEIPIIMSPFGRGSLAHKNAEEGSGLGLPIVKNLVELHGGTFTLRSKIRKGTEAIVIFPPERVMRQEPAA